MIIHHNIIAAAEKRKPEEIQSEETRKPDLAVEALLPPDGGSARKPGSDFTLAKRAANLSFAGVKPSSAELERLIGNNDLVDEFYLQRALVAARPVMRITLRDDSGRERGWATGLMVAPRLLLTNWHVFPLVEETRNAIAEAQYVLDIAGHPAPSYRYTIRGDLYYLSNQQLDFALVAVDETALDGMTPLARFGYHRLIAEPNKIREGECMTLIQHPGGERRQFSIRENQLVKILDQFLWYKSDTAPGSSGAPAFNDSFQVVALHHSGAARRDESGLYLLRDGRKLPSLDGIDDSQVDWVANEGLRISVLCAFLCSRVSPENPYVKELFQAMRGGDIMSNVIQGGKPQPFMPDEERAISAGQPAGQSLAIPLQLNISLTMPGGLAAATPAAASAAQEKPPARGGAPALPAGVEALRYPIVDRDYTTRTGYVADFLGVPAPLPQVTDPKLVARMADGGHELPYEHFTIVIHKQRRLALFTACNVDYSQAKRRPEPGDYSRKGLTGLGEHDQEKWLTDPRVPQQDQLPDIFYTKDGGFFDKGHIVRREDMCWGGSRDQIVRANGDTFHVTNCTPQIAGFNRSTDDEDNWGDLENEIQKQGKIEKLSIFAGPILAENDKFFEGKDDFGPYRAQIPREFWKVVLANDQGALAAYAFILQQDLQNLPEEFAVSATWQPYLVSLATLEARLSGVKFTPAIHAADRSANGGHELARAIGARIHPSLSLVANEVGRM